MSNDNVNDNVRAILDEIRALKRSAEKFGNHDYMTGYVSALSALEGFIAGLPAVDAVPVVHAHWIDRDGKTWCSECGASNKAYNPPFCPHCGAKMDGDGSV